MGWIKAPAPPQKRLYGQNKRLFFGGERNGMKLYLSDYRENEKNALYPHEIEINGAEDMKRAAQRDHMASRMKDHYRDKDNFLSTDCLMFDIDNTHSEDPHAWVTEDDIAEAFPVKYYLVRSRNYMKEKRKIDSRGNVTIYQAREKWHVYAPLKEICTDPGQYERLTLFIMACFPYIDAGAIDTARFFYGVKDPHVTEEQAGQCIDEYGRENWNTLKETCKENIRGFADRVKSGLYEDTKGTRNVIEKVSAFLKIENPLTGSRPTDNSPANDEEPPDWIKYIDQERAEHWLENWAGENGVILGRRYTFKRGTDPHVIAYCIACPWEDEHSMTGAENEAVIQISSNGQLAFLCRHSHGAALNWKKYRAKVEEEAAKKRRQQTGQREAEPEPAPALPGLLSYEKAVNIFKTADDRTINMQSFPAFSKVAKIKLHDTIALAADTGAGKSSLAINFIKDLNSQYPVIYFNLEMTIIQVLQRLVAIHSGIEIDSIETYKRDPEIEKLVNITLEQLITEPWGVQKLQVLQQDDAHTLEQIEDVIELSTRDRNQPTIVFIDHGLLISAAGSSNYEKYTELAKSLRRIALKYNIILFVLLQQNRAGKSSDEERPRNSSLKESGEWENSTTHVVFLWYDPADRKKKLIITKNRNGDSGGEFPLDYFKKTQRYQEAADQGTPAGSDTTAGPARPQKLTKREKQRQRLETAYKDAYIATWGKPTLNAVAEAADVTTATIKSWLKEYGGCTINGKRYDPAGRDTEIEIDGFFRLTPADNAPEEIMEGAAEQEPARKRL